MLPSSSDTVSVVAGPVGVAVVVAAGLGVAWVVVDVPLAVAASSAVAVVLDVAVVDEPLVAGP